MGIAAAEAMDDDGPARPSLRSRRHGKGTGLAQPAWLAPLDHAAFWGLALLLVWAPLPLASKRAWALALLAIGLCLVLVLAVVVHAGRRGFAAETPWRSSGAHWPLAALVAFAGWVALQLVPLPQGLLALLAPGGPAGGEAGAGGNTISVDVWTTRLYLLSSVGYAAAFAAVLMLVRTEQRVRQLALVLVASAMLQAVLAILLLSLDQGYVFLGMPFEPGDRAMGTFANTDHLANYLLMGLALGVGLLLGSWQTGGRPLRTWQQRAVLALQLLMSRKLLLRLLLVLMVLALVLTRSRAGNGAFLLALLATAGLCAWRSAQLRRPALWLAASMLVVDLLVLGQWVGLDKVVQRMEATSLTREQAEARMSDAAAVGRVSVRREESLEERWIAAGYALGMVAQRPVAGFGAGSFYTAFPPYKGDHPLGFYDHAHNDYVEMAATTGLVGLVLLLLATGATAWRVVSLMDDRRPPLTRGLATGIAMALLCMALHAAVDFPLQMPANALTFTVVLALAWCLPRRAGGRSSAGEARQGRSWRQTSEDASAAPAPALQPARVRAAAALLVAAAACLWVLQTGGGLWRADRLSLQAQQTVADWATAGKGWTADSYTATRNALLDALQLQPKDPELHLALAQLYVTQGQVGWADPVQREAFFEEALVHQQQALAARPLDGPTWLQVAISLQALGRPLPEQHHAWEQARMLAGREAPVMLGLVDLALAGWDTATPAMQQWVRSTYAAAAPALQRAMQADAKRRNRAEPLQMTAPSAGG